MDKTSVKIIKRKDAAAMANDKTQNLSEPKLAAKISGENTERRLRRKMADTVSNWIAERRAASRAEESSAIRRIFGNESLLSKIA